MKYQNIHLLIIGIITISLLVLSNKSSYAFVNGGAGSFKLLPATQTITSGQNASFDIYFNTAGISVSSLQSRLTLANNGELEVLQVIPYQDIPGAWTVPIATSSSQAGTTMIDISAFNFEFNGFTSSEDVKLATIVLKANQPFAAKSIAFSQITSLIRKTEPIVDIVGTLQNATLSSTSLTSTLPSASPNYSFLDLYTLLRNYGSIQSGSFITQDNKTNMFDALHVLSLIL